MDRDPTVGTTMQEICFWKRTARTLKEMDVMRCGIQVRLTLKVLSLSNATPASFNFDEVSGNNFLSVVDHVAGLMCFYAYVM